MEKTEIDNIEDLTRRCAEEPIRIPGSIQPQGFLFAAAADSLEILQVSRNVSDWLGYAPSALLGRPLDQLVGDGIALLSRLDGDQAEPRHLGSVQISAADGRRLRFEWVAHRQRDIAILEFGPIDEQATYAFAQMYPLVRTFVQRLPESGGVEGLCELAVAEIKRLTGYGRVLAYRFDDEGHGEVIAEQCDEGYDRYLGLHFPASDIPAQARELYKLNRIRVIPNANYEPALLEPPLNPRTGEPLDLGFALLRSVSPVHLQYMRNMGTLASMSVSIVVDGQLWGLISCHHHEPRPVRFHTRTACEMLGSVLSLQIAAKQAHDIATHMLRLRKQSVGMLGAIADRDSVHLGLLAQQKTLLEFARADGAAIVTAAGAWQVGLSLPAEDLEQLVRALGVRGGELFSTDSVTRDLPELPQLATHVGGLMAVSISELHPHYLVWYRQETVRSVSWAGEPSKTAMQQGGRVVLSPRASFRAWKQILHGFCAPWLPAELDGALEFRAAILGIVLRKAEEMAEMANELKRANQELESFSYSVSHDLRAPLRHIASYAELMVDTESETLSERGQHFLDNIFESARFAGQLVDNLLTFSQMGRSEIRPGWVDVSVLVGAVQREMRPDYLDRKVDWQVAELPPIWADPTFLHLALRNLIANALKYTRNREVARIEIGAYRDGDEDVLYVRDNGVGFDMQYADKLFGVFQRLHRMEDFEGTGIGLANVRRIIERHHGRVWAEGEVSVGASFYIALPRHSEQPSRRRGADA